MNFRVSYFIILVVFWVHADVTCAQTAASDNMTLQQCIDYALLHQPALNQSVINETITKVNNRIALAGWLPQVNVAGTMTHYNVLPTAFETNPNNPNGAPIVAKTGIPNSATPQVTATETFISPSLIYAAKAATLLTEQARQITDSSKINLVSAVSKSFYGLLLTLEQIDVLKADTVELNRSVTDAYHQYVGGIVDETDYEEATITLNNTLAQLKQATESIVPQYATLKQLMGYEPEKQFNVLFDTSEMIRHLNIDSTEQLQYEKRIEWSQLQTSIQLQEHLVTYYKLQFLPTVSGFFNYYYEYGSNSFSTLFDNSYPYSTVGLSLSIPIFTGLSRVENVKKAKLQLQLLDWDKTALKSEIYSEYTMSIANYNSNLYAFHIMRNNANMAKRVYDVVEMQYKQGIVAYLNVITAQSNLIASEIGYINAMFQALSSKIDVQKAMGDIKY